MRSIPRSLAIGSAVMLGGVLVFVLLASALTRGSPMIRFDQVIADALRANLAPRALQVFAALTHLADTVTLTVLCVIGTLVLLVQSQRGLALAWMLAIAGNGVLNQSLKQFIGRIRPPRPRRRTAGAGFELSKRSQFWGCGGLRHVGLSGRASAAKSLALARAGCGAGAGFHSRYQPCGAARAFRQ